MLMARVSRVCCRGVSGRLFHAVVAAAGPLPYLCFAMKKRLVADCRVLCACERTLTRHRRQRRSSVNKSWPTHLPFYVDPTQGVSLCLMLKRAHQRFSLENQTRLTTHQCKVACV